MNTLQNSLIYESQGLKSLSWDGKSNPYDLTLSRLPVPQGHTYLAYFVLAGYLERFPSTPSYWKRFL